MMKCLILAMGPGETAHATGLGLFLHDQGWEIVLALVQPSNINFLKSEQQKFQIITTTSPSTFYDALNKYKPDLLVLCNSKAWNKDRYFQTHAPDYKPPTICLDSNWLFNREKYPWFPFVEWADRYLIVFPPSIFDRGLVENGGGFEIESSVKEKVMPVGFIPSYRPLLVHQRQVIREQLGLDNNDKLIFLYASGAGADFRPWIVDNLISSVLSLRVHYSNIHVRYIGPDYAPLMPLPRWITWEKTVDDFYEALAASDLVFQHHGMGTLPQAVSAGVPVIANVAIPGYDKIPLLHVWEVSPSAESGICVMHKKDDSHESITQSIEQLLFKPEVILQMRQAQHNYLDSGAEQVYRLINELMSNSSI